MFFWVFQAEDFGKLFAPVFRICLDRFRALGTEIRQISSYCSVYFSAFWLQKVWKSNFFLLFLKEQALKPCSGPRSRDSAQIRPIESSSNLNLTDLVKKEGRDFHFFSDTRYMAGKTPLLRPRITRRKKGNLKILHVPSFFFNDSTYIHQSPFFRLVP